MLVRERGQWRRSSLRPRQELISSRETHRVFDIDVLWRFFWLWLVIVPTPGANALMVTQLALTRPAAHVGFAVVGNVAGILLIATCALLGWAALLDTFPWLRVAVHVLGGAYLIYFGMRLLNRARQAPGVSSEGRDDRSDRTDRTEPAKAMALGFATALSNAQAILFITSIFAVSGVLATNMPTSLAVLCIIAFCNLSYLGWLGWMFRRPTVRAGYQRFRRWFEGAIGLLFVGFGGRLIWRELAR
jgi:threonine efflux protein